MRNAAASVFSLGLATCMLSLPAVWNGLAFLFVDSVEYLLESQYVTMRMHGIVLPGYPPPIRSLTLSLLYFRLQHPDLWPIVAVQSLLVAWLVWLTVRALPIACVHRVYCLVLALLTLCTTVGWYTGYAMADVYAPVTCLAVYLLVFAWSTLHTLERLGVMLTGALAITTHGSHLLIAAVLLAAVALLSVPALARPGTPRHWWRTRGRPLAAACTMVLVAMTAQVLVNRRMHGEASLFGRPPAFLSARLLADGPMQGYLQRHCKDRHWTLCQFQPLLPAVHHESDFLWAPDGIWKSATPAQQDALRKEQTALALALLRDSPRAQIVQSLRNTVNLILSLGPADYGAYPLSDTNLNHVQEGLAAQYHRSRQYRSQLPLKAVHRLQECFLLACVPLSLVALWSLRGRLTPLLRDFGLVVCAAILVNAFVCGALSGFDPRYSERLAWLFGLFAWLCAACAWLPCTPCPGTAERRTHCDALVATPVP